MRTPKLIAAAVAALVLMAPAPADAADKKGKLKTPRMAILDFPAAPGAWACSGLAGSETRLASVLRDLFTTEISDSADGAIRLVERERLNEIKGELNFQQSGDVDGATAQRIGKLLGVRYMLTGKMTRFACKKSAVSTGWGLGTLVGKATGSAFAGEVAGSVHAGNMKFTGRLDVRLIDVQSGEILGTFKDENETGDLSVKVAGGGAEVQYDDELANKVFEPIVKGMAGKIVKKTAKAHEENLEDDAADEADATPKAKARGGGKKGASDDDGAEAGSGSGGGKRVAKASSSTGDGDDAPAPKAEVFGNDFDFIPGEALLVFDDFSDTEVGDYPARWTLKDGGGAPAEAVEVDRKHWFHQRKSESTASWAQKTHYTWLRYQVKGDMPAKFTVELDVLAGEKAWYVLRYNGSDAVVFGPEYFKTANQKVDSPVWKKRQVQHISIAVNGTSLKAYVGGKRYLNDPDAFTRPITRLGLAMGPTGESQYDGIMFTNFRVAEGGKDITKSINVDGRIVTHGITFDSGSDVIRPESGPTLRKILKLLQDDSALAFEVQGHTDNQGGDKVNGPLSDRRARAVKAWLVGQGVEDGRLSGKGLGASKPLDTADTPEARANNRRVEFVKRG